jgi:hypothetical protein
MNRGRTGEALDATDRPVVLVAAATTRVAMTSRAPGEHRDDDSNALLQPVVEHFVVRRIGGVASGDNFEVQLTARLVDEPLVSCSAGELVL